MGRVQRFGSVIGVKPEKLEYYKKLHAAPWPEINAMIKACNIRNYSIYYKDGLLFSYYEYVGDDYEADMAKMAADPKTQEWWDECKPCQHPSRPAPPRVVGGHARGLPSGLTFELLFLRLCPLAAVRAPGRTGRAGGRGFPAFPCAFGRLGRAHQAALAVADQVLPAAAFQGLQHKRAVSGRPVLQKRALQRLFVERTRYETRFMVRGSSPV